MIAKIKSPAPVKSSKLGNKKVAEKPKAVSKPEPVARSKSTRGTTPIPKL